jgi:hypothetical protein
MNKGTCLTCYGVEENPNEYHTTDECIRHLRDIIEDLTKQVEELKVEVSSKEPRKHCCGPMRR